MKEYIKIGGAFELPVTYSHAHNESGTKLKMLLLHGKQAELAAHAINSHDELVGNMNHYKSEAEMWEGRAVKDASAHADMLIERGKLLEEIERLRKAADEVNEQLHDAIMDRKFQQ